MKTSEELHALHVELWGWLAETGLLKDSWPKWDAHEEIWEDYAGCFACFEAETRDKDKSGQCNPFCPITWDIHPHMCLGGSAYSKWEAATSPKTRKKYAAIIRDLPWSERPEVKP